MSDHLLTDKQIKDDYYFSERYTTWDLDVALGKVAAAEHTEHIKQGWKSPKEIQEIEYALYNINAQYGTKDNLCLFCHSAEYNSTEGIVHKPDCLILELRGVKK